MIHIEKPSEDKLQELNVRSWPVWEKEISEFPWEYHEPETCYVFEGEIYVTPAGSDTVKIEKGDLVVFSAGLKCTWKITKPVKKHYRFG
jgi:uncharacterized protein